MFEPSGHFLGSLGRVSVIGRITLKEIKQVRRLMLLLQQFREEAMRSHEAILQLCCRGILLTRSIERNTVTFVH